MISHRRLTRALSWFAMGLVLAFCVSEAWARGGRGGGGGRSVSRGGSASRGSFGGGSRGSFGSQGSYSRSRPSSGSGSMGGYSRQPARVPSQRPSGLPGREHASARPGGAGGGQMGGAERPGAGTSDRPSRLPGQEQPAAKRPSEIDKNADREDWQQHREDMQGDRQDAARDRQEDRQAAADDYWEEGGGAYWHGGVYVGDWDEVTVIHIDDDEEVEWAGVVAGFAFGTVVSAATYQSATTESGCELSEVEVNGETYFHCGDTWYSRAMQEGEVRYLVVPAPPGF